MWLDTNDTHQGAGSLIWMIAAEQDDGSLYPDYDGFTVYVHNDMTALFREYAQRGQADE